MEERLTSNNLNARVKELRVVWSDDVWHSEGVPKNLDGMLGIECIAADGESLSLCSREQMVADGL